LRRALGDVYASRSGANETEPLAKRSHNDGVLGGLRRSFARKLVALRAQRRRISTEFGSPVRGDD